MLTPRSYLFSRYSPSSNSPSASTSRSNSASKISPSKLPTERSSESKSARESKGPARYGSRGIPPTVSAAAMMTTAPITTTSDPVVIPVRSHRDLSWESQREPDLKVGKRTGGTRTPSSRRARDVHSPESLPPAVSALLSVTSIPPPKSRPTILQRRASPDEPPLTVDSILKNSRVSEKEISLSLGKSPMDVLLSPPEELDEVDAMGTEVGMESYLSSGTFSYDSTPSLEDESFANTSISTSSPVTPASRGRKATPTRKLQLVSSPPQEPTTVHPLASTEFDIDELDFRVFERPQAQTNEEEPVIPLAVPRRRSAFKSNLTASLRALRAAAKSISSITTPMITPDDFLTRSIISIDPRIPFTDERMPPVLDETPTPALRRYLNPTTNAPIEAHVPSSLAQATSASKCTASIQMQTYKISKYPQRVPPSVISRRTISTTPEEMFAEVATGPVARQRDMRENSDFIRIAVMEMMMRKHGKLDEKMPGRAKWALPPRQLSTKVYEIGEGGIPERWIAINA